MTWHTSILASSGAYKKQDDHIHIRDNIEHPKPSGGDDVVDFTGWTWRHARARPFSIEGGQGMRHITKRSKNELTLMAYEFDEPFAALMSSSARHSAMDFTLRNADSRV